MANSGFIGSFWLRKALLRTVSSILIASVLLSCSLTNLVSKKSSSTQTGWVNTGKLLTLKPGDPLPKLAAPPTLASLPQGTPEEQAKALVEGMKGGSDEIPAWLRLYDMLGVPVISEAGKTLGSTGEDPIGPRYWQVWYPAVLDRPGRGIALQDAARILSIGLDDPKQDTYSQALLNDLRDGLGSNEPGIRLLSEFVRQRGMKIDAGVDLKDPAATPDSVYIDVPTVALLSWVVDRALWIQDAEHASIDGSVVMADYHPSPAKLDFKANCSEALGSSDATYWANWLTGKGLSGGIQLPGMEKALPSLVSKIQERRGKSDFTISSTSKWIARASGITGAISLAMQLMSLDVNMNYSPDKLIRNKKVSEGDGKEMNIAFALVSDPGNLPDGNDARLCALGFISNALGVPVSVPSSGKISGAEVIFSAGQNFDRVNFAKSTQLRSITDSEGQVHLDIIGQTRKKDVKDSAKAQDLEFSVYIKAQPEESGLNSIANMFFNGLSFGAGGMEINSGLIGPIIDTLKLVHYDLGEYAFPMVDWATQGWKADGTSEQATISGFICSLDQPFVLDVTFPGGTGTMIFAPASEKGGTYTYEGSGGGVTMTGNGNYTVTNLDTNNPLIKGRSNGCTSAGKDTCHSIYDEIELTPLEDGSCDG